MANFAIHNVEIAGISVCVPKNSESNNDYSFSSKEEMEKFVEATGVKNRRVVLPETCTSDLCHVAADKLLNELGWERSEIDVLVFVSQTPDYLLPVTSATLQHKLGISKDCIAFDIPLGCSGYIYGLSVVASMMRATGLKKGLLLVGDTSSKIISPKDKSTKPLFGDAGSATCLELCDNDKAMLFNLGTDGSGYKAIIVPDGGAKNQTTAESFVYKTYEEGIERNNCQLVLDGMDVFSFGITQAPKTVNALLERFHIEKDSVDYFVFHQANMMMNKMIAKKLKLPEAKVPYSLNNFGNTSSASIPVTIISELQGVIGDKKCNLILCGFGVGLSWGTVCLKDNRIKCLPLIEL